METLLDRRTPPGRRMGHWDETAILIAYRHGPRASELCTHVHAPRRRDHLRRPDCSACCASHAPGIRISSAMIIMKANATAEWTVSRAERLHRRTQFRSE